MERPVLTLADFDVAAREILPHAVYEFLAAGAGDEVTLVDNKFAFDRIKLRLRIDLQRLSHPDGEVATARGAGDASAILS